MVCPTLVIESSCSIRKLMIECRFSSGKARIQMHGILLMFIDLKSIKIVRHLCSHCYSLSFNCYVKVTVLRDN